jgi:site-specific recombinase XerD
VAALKAWLEAAAITEGPVFWPTLTATRLTDGSVAAVVKAHARRAGLDPKQFAAHSLRSGFLTSAAGRGGFTWTPLQRHREGSILFLSG